MEVFKFSLMKKADFVRFLNKNKIRIKIILILNPSLNRLMSIDAPSV